MSNTNQPTDEIDLNYLFGAIGKSWRNLLRVGFSAIDFLLKYWYVGLVLVIIGIIGGYFWQNSEVNGKTSKVLVQVNFDGAAYLYQTVELVQKKLDQGDDEFLSGLGLNTEEPELTSVVVAPVVRMQDIVSRFEDSNRSLESVLKNVEFEEDEEFALFRTFDTDYRYHTIEFGFTEKGQKEMLAALMDYINNNPAIEQLRTLTVTNLERQVQYKEVTLVQIDSLIEELREIGKDQSIGSGTLIVQRNDDFDQLIRSKVEIQNEIKELQKELILTDKTVVPLSNLAVYPAEETLKSRRMIILPIILFGGFCLFAFFRYLYFKLRNVANAPEE